MKKYYGVENNQDLNPGLLTREVRPFRQRFSDYIEKNKGYPLVLAGILSLVLPFTVFPQIADLLCFIAILYFLLVKNKQSDYILRRPVPIRKNDTGNGLLFLGNDRDSNIEIWLSNEDIRTHVLVFGTTGSGKTRALLGFLYQAVISGSGMIYVDGKGDNTVWWLVFDLCRRVNRLDDLLVMNYLTEDDSEADKYQDSQFERITNTNNPFAYGSSEQLRSLIVGLMRESGGEGGMWKGRASAMLAGLLKGLCDLRDKNEINLSVEQIRSHFPLDTIIELRDNKHLKDASKAAISKYLAEIPGWNEEDAKTKRIKPEVYKQHGFLLMQLTEVMADLSDTYGHIFDTPRGEVDFKDVVFNRRILFVMLPSLTKDPDALQGLGKLVVSGIRAALGPALGNRMEGSKRDVIDKKPTNSKDPLYIILDEYGYYSVPGFAVVAAQARSLGVSVVFAGQDYPSFKKSDENEAKSVVANTGLKICMKLEDPDETAKIIIDRAGEADVSITGGHERKDGKGFKDQGIAKIERRNRINLRDLVAQKPGEAHVIYGDTLIRCRMFYADPPDVPFARINKYVIVNPPAHTIATKVNKAFDFFKSRLDEKENKYADEVVEVETQLYEVIGNFKFFRDKKERPAEAGALAVGLEHCKDGLQTSSSESHPAQTEREVGEDKELNDIPPVSANHEDDFGDDADISDFDYFDDGDDDEDPFAHNSQASSNKEDNTGLDIPDFGEFESDNNEEHDAETDSSTKGGINLNAIENQQSLKDEAASYRDSFRQAFDKAVELTIEKKEGRKLSSKEKFYSKPINQLKQIEETQSSTDESDSESKKGIDLLERSFTYPKQIKAKKPSREEVKGTLQDLLDTINRKSDKNE